MTRSDGSVASFEKPISTQPWSDSVYGKTPRCSAGGAFSGDGGCCFAGGGGGGGGVDMLATGLGVALAWLALAAVIGAGRRKYV